MFLKCGTNKLDSILPNNEDKLKCGDIYIRTSGIISLACGFCDVLEFFTLDAYSNHFLCHYEAVKQPTTNSKIEQPISQSTSQVAHSYTPLENLLNIVPADGIAEDPLQSESSFSLALQSNVCDEPLQRDVKHENVHIISDSEVETGGLENSLIDSKVSNHIRRGKIKRQPARCMHCDEVFAFMPELRKHLWTTHNIGYKCRLCDKQFYDRKNRFGHERKHSPEDQVCICNEPDCPNHEITCEICKEQITSKSELFKHKWRVHLVGVPCRHCDRQFASKNSRDDHEKRHTGEPREIKKRLRRACYCKNLDCPKHNRRPTPKRPPSKCDHCDGIFALKRDLRKHLWTVHSIGQKCRFCDKQFFDYTNRNGHERTHTGEQPFPCTYCPRTFNSATSMRFHIMGHEDNRPFLCTFCGKKFLSSYKLSRHTKEEHTPGYIFSCSHCDKTFESRGRLYYHRKSVHNQTTIVLTCDICKRNFANRKCLVQHMKIHTGKKPYKCRYCGMSFAQAAGKRGHERNKHEDVVI